MPIPSVSPAPSTEHSVILPSFNVKVTVTSPIPFAVPVVVPEYAELFEEEQAVSEAAIAIAARLFNNFFIYFSSV